GQEMRRDAVRQALREDQDRDRHQAADVHTEMLKQRLARGVRDRPTRSPRPDRDRKPREQREEDRPPNENQPPVAGISPTPRSTRNGGSSCTSESDSAGSPGACSAWSGGGMGLPRREGGEVSCSPCRALRARL